METISGEKRRYYMESLISNTDNGMVYRAFSRRKSNKVMHRRYYALITPREGDTVSSFNSFVKKVVMSMPYPIYVDEVFNKKGKRYVVLAKGIMPSRMKAVWMSIQNRGYLMLGLALLILIMVLIKIF